MISNALMKLIVDENMYVLLGVFVTFLDRFNNKNNSLAIKVKWKKSCSECLHLSSFKSRLAKQQHHYLNI